MRPGDPVIPIRMLFSNKIQLGSTSGISVPKQIESLQQQAYKLWYTMALNKKWSAKSWPALEIYNERGYNDAVRSCQIEIARFGRVC